MNIADNSIVQNAYYYVFEKVFSGTNASTAYRYSTIVNDLAVFRMFPVFGCGDGLQGYWYEDNLQSWMLNVSYQDEFNSALSGNLGVLNGGSFLPALLSSFGIVGVIVFVRAFVKGYTAVVKDELNKRMGSYRLMYFLSIAALIPILLVGVGFHACFYVYLVLAMPSLALNKGTE